MFQTVPLSIIRSFSLYTQQWYMSYRFADSLRADQDGSVLILLATCQQRNCPKHVEFYSKNKYEKLVYLVGFIIRIYHDARSPERQIHPNSTHKCHNSKQIKCVSHTKTNSLMLFIEIRKNRLLSASQDIHTH